MAHLMLSTRALSYLMPRLLITSLTIYAVGCIIPAPLEAEPTQQQHTPIVSGADPDFGVITMTDPWTVSVTVSDDDLQAPLYARLYWKHPMVQGGFDFFPLDKLVIQASGMRDRHSDLFTKNSYCALTGGSGQKQIYVYVKDSDFGSNEIQPQDFKGRYDFKYWVVNCQ